MIRNGRYTITSNFGDSYIESPNTHDLMYECPHCKELGKKTSDHKLYVNYDTLVFHCFRCGWKGKLSQENSVDEGSSDRFIRNIRAYKRRIDVYSSVADDDEDELDTFYKLPSVIPAVDDPAVLYLNKRGVSYDEIVKYNMRVASIDDQSRFFGRVVIPNKLIAGCWTDMYSARAYIDLTPKYLNPRNSPKNKIVFNLHNIEDNCEQIIINEGVLTSIVAGPDSVAIYGKSATDEQVRLILSKNPKRIYVSLDNDADPKRGIMKDPTKYKVDQLVYKLLNSSKSELYLVKMPAGMDAVDVGRELYRNLFIPNSVRIRDRREYDMYSLK